MTRSPTAAEDIVAPFLSLNVIVKPGDTTIVVPEPGVWPLKKNVKS